MKFHHGMTCPVCEVGTLKLEREDMEFDYKGRRTVLRDQEVFKCHECDESFLDQKNERHVEKCLADERRRIDGLLSSDEIRTIRKQFAMTQTEFAATLRVVEKTFARYESGQSTQSYAMDNLLRILWKYPFTIESIKQPSLEDVLNADDGEAQMNYEEFPRVNPPIIHYETSRKNVIQLDFSNKNVKFSSQKKNIVGYQESDQHRLKIA